MSYVKTTVHPGWSARMRPLPSVEWGRVGLLAGALGVCAGFWTGVALLLEALI